jgi:hypothetical protein
MGSQHCPFSLSTSFACGGGSHDFTVINERTGEKLNFPQLMAHLVRDHYFFEGNTPYRLDPEVSVRVLELKQGVDYTPRKEKENIWRSGGSDSNIDKDFFGGDQIVRNAEQIINLSPDVTLYREESKALIVARAGLEVEQGYIEINGDKWFVKNIYRGRQMIHMHEEEYITG